MFDPTDRLPVAAFFLVALVGWTSAAFIWTSADRTERVRFAAVADEATNRIGERLRLHLLLIEATAANIEAQGDLLNAARFATYFDELKISERYPGIAGLGYAPFAFPEERRALGSRLAANYGRPVPIRPEPGTEPVAPVAIIGSPDLRPPPAVGFDMYSDPARRTAMLTAIDARDPRATEPVKLATDTEPAPGFIVYAPIYGESFGIEPRDQVSQAPTGFAFGGFRIGELAGAALHVAPFLPISLTVADADAPDTPLYAYGAAPRAAYGESRAEVREVDVAGQSWTLHFLPTDAFQLATGRSFAVAIALFSTALAGAAAFALRAQARARLAAEALAAANARSLVERDLLLQEMKHRIKNAITRILAIARQTARQASDFDAFAASFTQRLQAMAEAQDMLTRSADATADLAELLGRELKQVFGADFDPSRLRGTPIELDATRTQALGLVFHELATNALKYGGAAGRAPAIDVAWSVASEGPPVLEIEWTERGGEIAPPSRTGFGTKLIDATIRHELGGAVARDWPADGLVLRLSVPLTRP